MRKTQQNAASAVRVIGLGVGACASIAADFAPVPYMGPVVAIVIGITQLCDNVRVNK